MGLKSILENRVPKYREGTQEHDVVGWLNRKADEIKLLASKQLKHISNFFEEFDIHDDEHSMNILTIMENLLGEEAEKLSSYDLFSLIAVSYLHDCGMAISDYELKVLDIVENEGYDGKKTTPSEAKEAIINHQEDICGNRSANFEGEIRNWVFVPENKEKLIEYFANLLLDYQDYRNGKRDVISNSDNLEQTNKEERLNYVRLTHHERVEKYIKNWGASKFNDFPGGMGQELADNIAKCCLAHGETENYIKNNLSELTDVMYYGSETSNLQFISIMLRLGDLIDYNFNRAHPVLRALHHFKIDLSFEHWRIKGDNALSFSVKNGKVACVAKCNAPRDYYRICSYVDEIDKELDLYHNLNKMKEWSDYPNSIADKVNRKYLRLNKRYKPVPGVRFTLDQNNVLRLLMGAKLYTNEYACLRELYQNSLDACRCQMAKDHAVGKTSSGKIQFGLGEENGRKYVYCLDNGKGMTKEIIEKYLLHIGTSYYSSSDFYKKQAETKADFTPTSQFGIGMLSCYMIGDEIIITTREEGSDLISCGIDGPNECFYYINQPSDIDQEMLCQYNSGTLVKVFLNDDYKSLLNNDPLENYASLLWYNGYDVPNTDDERWFHHLYNIINDFVLIVPESITVSVSLNGSNELIRIYNKPLPITKGLQKYAQLNYGTDDDYYQFEQLKEGNYLDIQVTDNDLIQDKDKSLECRMIIEVEKEVYGENIRMNGGGRCGVDGIAINDLSNSNNSLLYRLMNMGALNFIGTSKPQLSVNRDDIINLSIEKYEQKARDLLEALIKKSINEVCAYIKKKKIPSYKPLYNEIWYRLLRKFEFFTALFYKCLQEVEICHNMIMPFQGIKMTFGDFIQANETTLSRKEMRYEVKYSIMQLLLLRLLDSEKIEFSTENELVMIGHKGLPEFIPDVKRLDVYDYYFCLSQHDSFWSEYDIVQFAKFRFISNELKNRILSDDEVGRYYHSDNFIYFTKGFVKKLKTDRKNRKFRKYETTDISQKSTIIFVDNCGLYKIGNFIYDIIGDLIFYLMSKQEIAHYFNHLGIRYSGLTLHVHNKSVLLLLEMNRDHKNRKICFAKRGKCTRQELLNSIPDEWKERIQNVLFVDGSVLSPEL